MNVPLSIAAVLTLRRSTGDTHTNWLGNNLLILKARRGNTFFHTQRGVCERESAEPEGAPPGTCLLARLSGGDTCTYAIVIKL